MVLKCLVCSGDFKTSHKSNKYCSKKCYTQTQIGKKPVYSFTSETAKKYGFQKNNEYVFKKGYKPWNAKSELTYSGLHQWVHRILGKASKCTNGHIAKQYVWANISGEYRQEESDWKEVCQSCNLNDGVKKHERFKMSYENI